MAAVQKYIAPVLTSPYGTTYANPTTVGGASYAGQITALDGTLGTFVASMMPSGTVNYGVAGTFTVGQQFGSGNGTISALQLQLGASTNGFYKGTSGIVVVIGGVQAAYLQPAQIVIGPSNYGIISAPSANVLQFGGTTSATSALCTAASFRRTPVVITPAASVTISMMLGQVQTITLSANTTLALSGLVGGDELKLQIIQNASTAYTVTFPSACHGFPAVTTTLGACTTYSATSYNGTTLLLDNVSGLAV